MRLILLTMFLGFCSYFNAVGQAINWRSFEPNQQLASVGVGLDQGLIYRAGYAQRIGHQPLVLTLGASLPSGQTLLDDFNVRLGIQVEVVRVGYWSATLKADGVFRRFENPHARLLNWGGTFGGIVGYYKPTWYVAGELGFDKAIVTHVRHSPLVMDGLPGLRNGWYIPTGGTFRYGLQTGVSLSKTDLTLRVGRLLEQDFKTLPMLPFHAQLGVNRRF
jgi:hypothetical protein